MGSHPINLALRFLLEIAALLALGVWGWQKSEGWLRPLLAFGIPVVAAVLWATFRVPGDPGAAPVAVPGILRLIFELGLFALATWSLYSVQAVILAWIFGTVAVVHYIFSFDRILWLLKQ